MKWTTSDFPTMLFFFMFFILTSMNYYKALDMYVSMSFFSNEYNQWFSERVAAQLGSGKLPPDLKISLKFLDIKPLHAN